MSRLFLSLLLLAIVSTTAAQAPANDECINAIPITVSATSTCSNSVNATSEFATQSMAPCVGATAQDVWFSFVATDAAQIIQLTNTGILLPVIEVFSGTCGSLVSLGCFSAHVNDLEYRKSITGLTIGNTYYIRVYANNPDGRSFSLCIFPPAANDECTGATNIPVSTGYNWNYVTTSNVDNSPSGSNCMTNNVADGWFQFTALDTVHLIHLAGQTSTNFSNYTDVQVYEGSCGALSLKTVLNSSGNSTNCFFPGTFNGYYTMRGLTVGNTYYIKVEQDMIRFDNPYNFNIAIGSVPANDGITGAEVIAVNAGTECASKTSGNFRNASPTIGLTQSCGTSSAVDLWYQFTATAARHLIRGNYASFNGFAQVFYMDAGNLVAVGCSSEGGPYGFLELTSLTPGTVYYVRIKGGGQSFVDRLFDICITTPGATAANDDCAAAPTIPLNNEILSSIRGATFTAGMNTGCSSTGTGPKDIWYTFTPATNTSAVLQFVVPSVVTSALGIEVHTGTCGALTRIACANPATINPITDLHFTANAGVTHYVRIYEFGAGPSNGPPFLLSFSQFAPLPVTITAFKAAYTNGSVKLTWNTEEESDINYYDVERSSNGIQFNQLSRVPARNIAAPSEYVAEDLSPIAGVSYYRLKIVDVDGKVEYSRTVKMDTDGSFTGNLKVSRQGNFILVHNNNADFKNVTLNIFTATGQKIYSAAKRLTGGVNSIPVPGKTGQPLFIQLVTEDNVAKTFKVF